MEILDRIDKIYRISFCSIKTISGFAGKRPFSPPFKLFLKNRCLRDNDLKKADRVGVDRFLPLKLVTGCVIYL